MCSATNAFAILLGVGLLLTIIMSIVMSCHACVGVGDGWDLTARDAIIQNGWTDATTPEMAGHLGELQGAGDAADLTTVETDMGEITQAKLLYGVKTGTVEVDVTTLSDLETSEYTTKVQEAAVEGVKNGHITLTPDQMNSIPEGEYGDDLKGALKTAVEEGHLKLATDDIPTKGFEDLKTAVEAANETDTGDASDADKAADKPDDKADDTGKVKITLREIHTISITTMVGAGIASVGALGGMIIGQKLDGTCVVFFVLLCITALCFGLAFANFGTMIDGLPDNTDTLWEAVFDGEIHDPGEGTGTEGSEGSEVTPPGDNLVTEAQTEAQIELHEANEKSTDDAVNSELRGIVELEDETKEVINLADKAEAAKKVLAEANLAADPATDSAKLLVLTNRSTEATANAQAAADELATKMTEYAAEAQTAAENAEAELKAFILDEAKPLEGLNTETGLAHDGVAEGVDEEGIRILNKKVLHLKAIAKEAAKASAALADNGTHATMDVTLIKTTLEADLKEITAAKNAISRIVAITRRLCQIEVPAPDPSPSVLSSGILLLGILMLTWLFYAIRKRYKRYVRPKLHLLQQVVVHTSCGGVQLLYTKQSHE